MNARELSSRGANGKLQATIFKKGSRDLHRPESNKGCAGACQHTCEAISTDDQDGKGIAAVRTLRQLAG
jgi:hypothetical protein